MKLPMALVAGGALFGVFGCMAGGGCGNEVPARLVGATPESRAELYGVVSGALGADVALSEDALTEGDVLIVEQKPHRDILQGRVMGRDLGKSEQFHLLKHGEKCVLVRLGTGERWVLARANCTAK